ncbi:MAG: CerR family C-terminal domain-containing protein [Tepidisphaeraceae bacterium]
MPNVKNNAASQVTKHKLLEAAGEVFAEQGFERATIKEITDRAGVAMAAVNYHFSDKQELYYQVIKLVHQLGMEAAAVIINPDPSMSPTDQFREYVRKFLRSMLDPTRPAWFVTIMMREMRQPSEATERLMDEIFRPHARALENLVNRLVGRQIPHRKTILIAQSIISQCVFLVDHQIMLDRFYPEFPPAAQCIDELADHMTEFSLAAIRGLYPPAKG